MNKTDLDKKLVQACKKPDTDFNEIQELIIAGANTNQQKEYGYSIFDFVFADALADNCEDKQTALIIIEKIKKTIQLMVDNGWDIKKFGIEIMSNFKFTTYDRLTFEMFKFMLGYDLTDNPENYKKALDVVGTEESYQRCCEENHDLENLFYAIYEMILAKMEGRDYNSIELYYDAIDMRIDKVIYLDKNNTTVKKQNFTEYNADIGFVCGHKLLVLREGVNILFMNDRINEQPQIDFSADFGRDIIGKKIKSISFEHKEIVRGKTGYGQPTIIMELTNGRKLKFTHNFGELPNKKSQSRFWIET